MAASEGIHRAQTGGVLLGIGMGGFVDGILLHQILQWLWDGLFHALVWIVTLTGIVLLWSGARRAVVLPTSVWLVGLMLIGWGLFNFTEGLIDHHILGIHHVREWGPSPVWDFGFLLSGPVLIGTGWLMTRSDAAHDRGLTGQ